MAGSKRTMAVSMPGDDPLSQKVYSISKKQQTMGKMIKEMEKRMAGQQRELEKIWYCLGEPEKKKPRQGSNSDTEGEQPEDPDSSSNEATKKPERSPLVNS